MTKRILIIDDEPDLREIIQLSIEAFTDWRVDSAATGSSGLQKAQVDPYDVILLDISMPDMDGFQVFEHLQAHADTQPIPVILLTAKVQPSDRHQFMKMNIAGFIRKPFASEAIAHQIAEILGWLP